MRGFVVQQGKPRSARRKTTAEGVCAHRWQDGFPLAVPVQEVARRRQGQSSCPGAGLGLVSVGLVCPKPQTSEQGSTMFWERNPLKPSNHGDRALQLLCCRLTGGSEARNASEGRFRRRSMDRGVLQRVRHSPAATASSALSCWWPSSPWEPPAPAHAVRWDSHHTRGWMASLVSQNQGCGHGLAARFARARSRTWFQVLRPPMP